jgi:AraC-like DNA-binding protein
MDSYLYPGKKAGTSKKAPCGGEISLDYIAYEIGYANRSGLIKLFKKYVECRPEEWRGLR